MYDMWVFLSFWDFSPKNTPEKIAKKEQSWMYQIYYKLKFINLNLVISGKFVRRFNKHFLAIIGGSAELNSTQL